MKLLCRRFSSSLLTIFLVLSLLCSQVLGLMHGIVHAPDAHGLDTSEKHAQVGEAKRDFRGSGDHADRPVSGWLKQLFSSHEEGSDCKLYDQASHGSAVTSVAFVALPIALASLLFDLSRGEALARWAALFQARGPPITC